MLVISRKHSEVVFIGADIAITIVSIDRGKVRLGIAAPKDVPILRSELASQAQMERYKENLAREGKQ